MTDLDSLLHTDPPETDMSAVADALQEGYAEHWQVALISRYLLTPEQSKELTARQATISDLLNGHMGNAPYHFLVEWNEKLGRQVFFEF